MGAAIARRLELDGSTSDRISMFVGNAANALIAAYGVRAGIVHASVLRRARSMLVVAARASRQWDVTSGAAGALLACAEMETVIEHSAPRELIRILASRVVAAADTMSGRTAGWYTGMAHGLAGAILALECAVISGAFELRNAVRQRHLDALLGAASCSEHGAVFWPQRAGAPALEMQSWCHGTPGVTLALLALHRITGEPAYAELAVCGLAGMRWLVDHRPPADSTLCCGTTGIAQVFVEAYRVLGDPQWLAAARRIEPLPARGARSLFKGDLGRTYLGLRLRDPVVYPMPGLAFARVTAARRA
jgi:lantibiotic modifying enzyme